jgi:hypothetical protein
MPSKRDVPNQRYKLDFITYEVLLDINSMRLNLVKFLIGDRYTVAASCRRIDIKLTSFWLLSKITENRVEIFQKPGNIVPRMSRSPSQNRHLKLKPTQKWRSISNRTESKDLERASAKTNDEQSPYPGERYKYSRYALFSYSSLWFIFSKLIWL